MSAGKAIYPERKPANDDFRQQELWAWQPCLTPNTIIFVFGSIGAFCLIFGGVLFSKSASIKELQINYSNCQSVSNPSITCAAQLDNQTAQLKENPSLIFEPCFCDVPFTIDKDWGKVFVYYGIEGLYQNYRTYVSDIDFKQLHGATENGFPAPSGESTCDTTENNEGVPIAPCGSIAASLFNDSYSICSTTNPNDDCLSPGATALTLGSQNVAWNTDVNGKYRNPDPQDNIGYGPGQAFNGTTPPANWGQTNLVTLNGTGQGFINQDLAVWLRTAATSSFRKLYRTTAFSNTGNYNIQVEFNYPVDGFGGSKYIIFSTIGWAGGKNPFLGNLYLGVGAVSMIICICFLIKQMIKPRIVGDSKLLTWDGYN